MEIYNIVLISMTVLAAIVFIALNYYTAGYGFLRTAKWGATVPNKLGWVVMEMPVFVFMTLMFAQSGKTDNVTISIITNFFLIHYFQRSFIFPFLIRGNGRMPISIILMGMIFNTLNAYIQGSWLYKYAPDNYYTEEWLKSPQFIIGTALFLWGMFVNIQSDHIIRNLRKKGDTRHYIPQGGMFKYVSSANYFGEIVEWIGFAIMTWSVSGAVFALWTCANLIPRSKSLYKKYEEEFGEEFTKLKRKKVIPYIY